MPKSHFELDNKLKEQLQLECQREKLNGNLMEAILTQVPSKWIEEILKYDFSDMECSVPPDFIDLRRHIYCIGSYGSGKLKFLKKLLCQAVWDRKGIILLDSMGLLSDWLLSYIPEDCKEYTSLLNLDIDYKWCFKKNRISVFNIESGTIKQNEVKSIGRAIFAKLADELQNRNPDEIGNEILVVLDGMHNFLPQNADLEIVIDVFRLYNAPLILTHESVCQIKEIIRVIQDNVGTNLFFKMDEASASYITEYSWLKCNKDELINLEDGNAYAILCVDGKRREPSIIVIIE